jgi:hypothetical protein
MDELAPAEFRSICRRAYVDLMFYVTEQTDAFDGRRSHRRAVGNMYVVELAVDRGPRHAPSTILPLS